MSPTRGERKREMQKNAQPLQLPPLPQLTDHPSPSPHARGGHSGSTREERRHAPLDLGCHPQRSEDGGQPPPGGLVLVLLARGGHDVQLARRDRRLGHVVLDAPRRVHHVLDNVRDTGAEARRLSTAPRRRGGRRRTSLVLSFFRSNASTLAPTTSGVPNSSIDPILSGPSTTSPTLADDPLGADTITSDRCVLMGFLAADHVVGYANE